ncbi:hypothetical protein FOVG_16216 [Fusarium oxysporum f. sp. pisi HDV247]|uniref:Uncharacterized protein n=1 Tax=Fusarium oxysporum f. sp. pisi HDV247 TaxID=1080344 RepID=W9NRB5_FUSOX|nr:hypothetical protein FOVG_16216 [Fusarium oxysporum f. sp. pisi HDV247]
MTEMANIPSSDLNDPAIMHPVEELFLDISIHEVLTQTMVTFVEPWKTTYIDSIREQRYGDAIWARYCIEGGVENGIMGQLQLIASNTSCSLRVEEVPLLSDESQRQRVLIT